MTDRAIDQDDLLQLTSEIVSAHVSNNPVPLAELPGLIQTVHSTLTGLNAPASEPQVELKPAVNPKKSVTDDYIVCLDCGKKMKMLKRHVQTDHGNTPAEYRARWNLPHDYPMVAPNYAKKRQELAKKIGLGRKPAAPASSPRRKKAAPAAVA